MAKETEKMLAKKLYIEQNKTPDEIAARLKVNRRTVDRWMDTGNWKKIRDAKANGGKERIERTQQVVDSLTDERLSILGDIKECQLQLEDDNSDEDRKDLLARIAFCRKQAASIDDAIAKWNKRIEGLNKETKVTLSMYMEVLEDIFEAMRQFNEPLYMNTLDFQEHHLEQVANKRF